MDIVGLTHAYCGSVLFTDKSWYCLEYTDRCYRVWKRQWEMFYAEKIAEHDRYGGGSVMVWVGICWDGCTDLRILDQGTLTAQRYRDGILDVHVRLYGSAVGDGFISMDDNIRPHTAYAFREYLGTAGIENLNWNFRFLDLNPIGHVWNELQSAILALQVQTRSLSGTWCHAGPRVEHHTTKDYQELERRHKNVLLSCN